MNRISDLAGQSLEWLQPKTLERYYELRAGPAHLATLTFHSAWGTLAGTMSWWRTTQVRAPANPPPWLSSRHQASRNPH